MLKKLTGFFIEIAEVTVFAVAIFLFVYLLILQPHKIKGASMEPNFPDGQYLLSDKVTYRFNEPKRGDIVVFKAPRSPDEEFIKRIIGLPSETLFLKDGKVVVDGKVLQESYLDDALYTQSGPFLQEDRRVTIPEDNYLVFGDNRNHSSDSRAWGFVPKENITGRGWVIYWPVDSAGIISNTEYNI
ncbi:signal peptidase I [Patescibacteria group bacterium]